MKAIKSNYYKLLCPALILFSCVACIPSVYFGVIVSNRTDSDIQLTLFRRDSTEYKYAVKAHNIYNIHFWNKEWRDYLGSDTLYHSDYGSYYMGENITPFLRYFWNEHSIHYFIDDNLAGLLFEYGKDSLKITDKERLSLFLIESQAKAWHLRQDFIFKIKKSNLVKWEELYGDR